jgi:hypothetical protein
MEDKATIDERRRHLKTMPEHYLQADGRERGLPLEDDDPFIAP